jgi:hypothetical protein
MDPLAYPPMQEPRVLASAPGATDAWNSHDVGAALGPAVDAVTFTSVMAGPIAADFEVGLT